MLFDCSISTRKNRDFSREGPIQLMAAKKISRFARNGNHYSLSFRRMDNEPLPIDWPTVWRDAGENKHAEWVDAVLSYKNSWVPGSAGYCQLCVVNLEPRRSE